MIGIVRAARVLPDPARRLVAVEHRQLDVHQDQVRALASRQAARPPRRRGLDQLVAGAGQQIADDPPVVLLVLDDQDALGHAATSCSLDP